MSRKTSSTTAGRTLTTLATAAKTNDPAFEEFHAQVGPLLHSRALRRVRDVHAATELADDTLLEWRLKWNPARCRDDAALLAWLYRTVARKIVDYLRRGRPLLPLEQDVPSPAEPSTLEEMIVEEDQAHRAAALRGARLAMQRAIRRVMRELSNKQRKKQAIDAPALLWLGRLDWWDRQLRTRPELFLESPHAMRGNQVAQRLKISAATVSRIQQRVTAEAQAALWEYVRLRKGEGVRG